MTVNKLSNFKSSNSSQILVKLNIANTFISVQFITAKYSIKDPNELES